MFKTWSQINSEAKDELRPDFGFRSWNDLLNDDKIKIWVFLWEKWFFNSNSYIKKDMDAFYSFKDYSSDRDYDKRKKFKRIYTPLNMLNHFYKANVYARKFLESPSIETALSDFYYIYLDKSENVVFELLSFYAKRLILEREEGLIKKEKENKKDFKKRNDKYKWEQFDDFAKDLNDKFDHFGIYVILTRQGFMPRQDEKIIKDIYNPVLKLLSFNEYKDVDEILKKAFKNFKKGEFDKVIQNSINVIHSYLQIKISKKIGKGNLKTLLKQAQKENIIPSDNLVSDIYSNIESFLARERQDKTDSHPSKGVATKSDALFILNLTMVILQSFLNYKKL